LTLSRLLLGFHVGSHEELSKKEKETQNVHKVDNDNSVTDAVALLRMKHEVSSLAHHGNKLNQLHKGQGRFPPDGQILASLWILSVHADEVVSVHDGMDESVQTNCEVDVSIELRVGVEPVEQKDGEMVVDVKERELSPLLSNDDEDGIPEIPNLGNVKEPEKISQGRRSGIIRGAYERKSVTVGNKSCFNGHVCTKEDL